jgi:hypothetical protein
MRHSIWRVSAIDTGAVLSAISRASARAAGSRSAGACSAHQARASASWRRTPAGVAPFERRLHAHQARQEPRRGRFGRDAAAREHEAEARVGGGQADVHRQLHRHADADGRAVDGADHRLQALEDAQRGDMPPPSR